MKLISAHLERFDSSSLKENQIKITASSLDQFRRSPHEFNYFRLNKKDSTKAMEFGTAFHAKCLESEHFKNNYMIEPDLRDYPHVFSTIPTMVAFLEREGLPTKGTKDVLTERILGVFPEARFWDEFKAELMSTKKILTDTEFQKIEAMYKHFELKGLAQFFSIAKKELPFYMVFEHEGLEIIISGRIDALIEAAESVQVFDIKTISKIDTINQLRFEIEKNSICQSLLYGIFASEYFKKSAILSYVFCETAEPYKVELPCVSTYLQSEGRAMIEGLLVKFIDCHKSNVWPSLQPGFFNLETSEYLINEIVAYQEGLK